ncbi:MAG: wax ester/triacylglycerol synthase family O-acyltransferase, partial [Congregibacter sp.]|nr:wax ester/triacylglycerol synthase family O-acyltransferase [Congregibacter sp.]
MYTQQTAPKGKVRFKQIIESIAASVADVPSLTRHLKEVPLGLDHPYWIDNGSFDPEFHIRHVALPMPGDWRQLCILLSRIHARPLDRSRPLWEIYVIEGLDGVDGYPPGSFALFTKMHHAAIDGASGMEITAAIHELSPASKGASRGDARKPETEPGNLRLIATSQLNSLKQPFRFLSVASSTLPGFARALMQLRRGELERVGNVPRSRFNGAVSPHRVFTALRLDLAEIKAIKNATDGATVNDVALSIVGGALRRYLATHNELPEDSLIAMAPINVRDPSEKGSGGNVVSAMAVQIRTDLNDDLERLLAVGDATRKAKTMNNAIGAKSMTDYSQFIPSTLTGRAARLASRWRLVNQVKPLFNCVVTNVPGPQVPLYLAGARMISYYGTGPVMD